MGKRKRKKATGGLVDIIIASVQRWTGGGLVQPRLPQKEGQVTLPQQEGQVMQCNSCNIMRGTRQIPRLIVVTAAKRDPTRDTLAATLAAVLLAPAAARLVSLLRNDPVLVGYGELQRLIKLGSAR
jgi:hypothetical protein